MVSQQSHQTMPATTVVDTLDLQQQFIQALPFTLTSAQQRVIAEINGDLSQLKPMSRLVQGDVGAGKTAVATAAAMAVLAMNCQVVMLVPTEILANQHFMTIRHWLQPFNIQCQLLTGKLDPIAKRSSLENIKSGAAQFIIGTHALLQKNMAFAKLGLVIIDEQHRFGVNQRTMLLKASTQTKPHLLAMTATPIPRSLALSLYADYQHSKIDEQPAGRQPITTAVLPQAKREKLVARVAELLKTSQQIYWVCPLIESTDGLARQSATQIYDYLSKVLPTAKIGLVHGKLSTQDKSIVMQRFADGELNLLVATTVIEVGVDVQNATLMVIENAECLGLAQIHQLRGRVGRGAVQSNCILLYHSPLTATGLARLSAARDCQDGFKLAELDLTIRGPGEMIGLKQSGWACFQLVDIVRDLDLLTILQTIDLTQFIDKERSHSIQAMLMRFSKE